MSKSELTSAYQPTGDQPEAIAQLTEGVREGLPHRHYSVSPVPERHSP